VSEEVIETSRGIGYKFSLWEEKLVLNLLF
jgi:hypothetical protein